MVGFGAGEDLRHFAPEDRVDRRAVAPDRECIADALGAVGVAQAHRVELEGADLAMRAVGEHHGQRDSIEARLDRSQSGHAGFLRIADFWL